MKSADFEAVQRLKVYSRRFRVRGSAAESTWFWLAAYLRRMRSLERRLVSALVTPMTPACELLQWVPRVGQA